MLAELEPRDALLGAHQRPGRTPRRRRVRRADARGRIASRRWRWRGACATKWVASPSPDGRSVRCSIGVASYLASSGVRRRPDPRRGHAHVPRQGAGQGPHRVGGVRGHAGRERRLSHAGAESGRTAGGALIVPEQPGPAVYLRPPRADDAEAAAAQSIRGDSAGSSPAAPGAATGADPVRGEHRERGDDDRHAGGRPLRWAARPAGSRRPRRPPPGRPASPSRRRRQAAPAARRPRGPSRGRSTRSAE